MERWLACVNAFPQVLHLKGFTSEWMTLEVRHVLEDPKAHQTAVTSTFCELKSHRPCPSHQHCVGDTLGVYEKILAGP